MSALMS